MSVIFDTIKKTIVFIGTNKKNLSGTGFLIKVQGITHLVTAKHVLLNKNDEMIDNSFSFFFNKSKGKIDAKKLSELKTNSIDWIFHKTSLVDLAIIPITHTVLEDVGLIPDADSSTLTSDKLIETDEIIFLSYQPGIEILNTIDPMIRKGMISRFNEDKTFYMDGFAFPGNSGSPVFQKPLIENITDRKFTTFPKLIGVIGEYLTYDERAISEQTGRHRITFEENTGLSRIWPVETLNEIILTNTFQTQIRKLKQNQKHSNQSKSKKQAYRK